MTRWLRAGVATAITDGTFSGVLASVFYGSTVMRLFQGVAAIVLGPSALDGGTRTMVIGIAMHCGVALFWAAVFVFVVDKWLPVRQPLVVAAVYGPLIWMVMSLLVIPALTHRATPITFRWWVQFVGHIPFVALPIVILGRTRRA